MPGKKSVIVLFLLLLAPVAFACIDASECPLPGCPGAIRLCDEGACAATPCIISVEDNYDEYQDYFNPIDILFEDASHHSDIERSIFSWVRLSDLLERIIFYIFLGIGIVGIVFLARAVRGRSHHEIAIILIILMFVLVGFSLLRIIESLNLSEAWMGTSVKSFQFPTLQRVSQDLELQYGVETEDLSEEELAAFSAHATDGIELRWTGNFEDYEGSILIFEFESTAALAEYESDLEPHFSKSRVGTETVYSITSYDGPGEEVSTKVWSEDRYLFVATGREAFLNSSFHDVYAFIPGEEPPRPPPTPPSPLRVDDLSITFLDPSADEVTSSPTITFQVQGEQPVVRDSISIINVPGFIDRSLCSGDEFLAVCEFQALHFNQGVNHVTAIAEDIKGRKARETLRFVYDSLPPKVVGFEPGNNSITRDPTLHLKLEDKGAGIANSFSAEVDGKASVASADCDEFEGGAYCSVTVTGIKQGWNMIRLTVRDMGGNSAVFGLRLLYDLVPPVITDISPPMRASVSSPRISFRVTDSVAVDTGSIRVEGIGGFENGTEQCYQQGESYLCVFDAAAKKGYNDFRIHAGDYAGNAAEVYHVFDYY